MYPRTRVGVPTDKPPLLKACGLRSRLYQAKSAYSATLDTFGWRSNKSGSVVRKISITTKTTGKQIIAVKPASARDARRDRAACLGARRSRRCASDFRHVLEGFDNSNQVQ